MKDSGDSISKGKNVLVVAAHPDDETLGAGGTIAKYVDTNSTVTAVFLTDGVGARGDRESTTLATRRREATAAAMHELGVSRFHFGDFPDNQLDTVPLLHVTQFLEDLDVENFNVVLTHNPRDLNIDHRIASEATNVVFRPQTGVSRLILNFEVLSSTNWQPPNAAAGFSPNWFVDISETLESKLEAISKYHDEIRNWPHSRSLRSIRALAEFRGSTCGVAAAEGFELARKLT
jgi:LmbE family N-acetylglucosaminyl deacetylase